MKNKGRLKSKNVRETLLGLGLIKKRKSVYLKIISNVEGGAK